MLRLIFRKIWNNKWLVICLIIGCAFAIAVVAAIPMYTTGLYNLQLSEEFKKEQERFDSFPFKAYLNASFLGLKKSESKKAFNDIDTRFYDRYVANIPAKNIFDYVSATTIPYPIFDLRNYEIKQDMITRGEKLYTRNLTTKSSFTFTSFAKVPEMITLVGGRMYSKDTEEGVVEAVITKNATAMSRISVGDTLYVYNKVTDIDLLAKIVIVGVVENTDESAAFYTLSDRTFMIDYDKMLEMIGNEEITLQSANWFCAFDYTTVKLRHSDRILAATKVLDSYDADSKVMLSSSNSYVTLLEKYSEDVKVMQRLYILLLLPVILMVGIYVVMISRLMMEREKAEISVLASRGASRSQIFFIYSAQGIVISVVSYTLGILIARLLCRLLGAANGFMEFVNRTAIDATLTSTALLYAAICATAYLVLILVPAYRASKFTIVQYKQNITEQSKKSFWQIIFLDVILIGIAIYFLYDYESVREYIQFAQITSVDFTLFVAVTFFVLGTGLLFIRLFPYLVELIFRIGKGLWKPASYAAFTHVARGGNYKQFIMIFLILAIGIGIFNANAGRTLNENLKDNLKHSIGADISFVPSVLEYDISLEGFRFVDNRGTGISKQAHKYCNSDLIENYTVYYYHNTTLKPSDQSVTFMGIETGDFGRVVKIRKDLNEGVPLNHILNILTTYPKGIIISRSISQLYNVKAGQYFDFTYTNRAFREVQEIPVKDVLVVAVVDYWPTMTVDNFIIMMQNKYTSMKHFRQNGKVLVDKKEGVSDNEVLEDMKTRMSYDESIGTNSFTDYMATQAKRGSVLNGINGILTLDFLISMLICCIGFIIFWIISVRQRVLQFGILRAMGMKKHELYRMIFYEQLMISFVSVLAGILIGGIASELFVPLFERMSNFSSNFLPFYAYREIVDYNRVYIITGAALIIGLSVILRFTSKLKVDQALKLGED